ncbi:hypothetical protein AiwAL_18125 [Acidiphilium sp. AL]|uniref:ABC transporter substrate-binding protein n=1 Tax=Acidiphilium sp. AL TaxID=2871704 RepID=UPI0021CB3EC1|nr:hypothetical protein [Acidiphilium sp. AL]MCU4161980.1 hypothetical protein [Acidiphilium sp. AL]
MSVLAAAGLVDAGFGSGKAFAATADWTHWGWPQPYQQISDKSVNWLKSKDWWPLNIAWNPLWSDGNILLYTMKRYKLLEKRGIKAKFQPILTAGVMNEAFIPGRIQIAQAGSLSLPPLIDLKIPTVAVATYPAQRQPFLVHPDSPLRVLSDLKGQKVLKRPAVCGVTYGSTNYLGLMIAARVLGLKEGTDFVVDNMGPGTIITMPNGVDVTAIWAPNGVLMVDFLKNARIIGLVDTYEIFNGYSYVRGEISQKAPDVVQAYVDAFLESRLLLELNSREIIDTFIKDPSQQGREPKLIKLDVEYNCLNPSPTINYPYRDTDGFWDDLEAFQDNIMAALNVFPRRYSKADFHAIIQPQYMGSAYARLGWKPPAAPAFIPADWKGKVGEPPYPPYGLMYMGKQNFPKPNDLLKPWPFGGVLYKP